MLDASEAVIASNALHQRVRRFMDETLGDAPPSETFDALACDIARFQRENVPAVARLWRALDVDVVDTARAIPGVPAEAFRARRIAAHPPERDTHRFMTSGTTAGTRGAHPMRTTETYARGALAWAREMLWPDRDDLDMLVLASPEAAAPESSLTFMLARFGETLRGSAPASFHYDGKTVDVAGVINKIQQLGSPVLVAGTSFAFVHLCDAVGEEVLPLPAESRVMQTGGFKGRSREVSPDRLREMLQHLFRTPRTHIVGEYGMTELSSQLYQGGPRGWNAERYYPPPWLRVDAVDAETLSPVDAPNMGLARFVDLANVDSSVVVQTADRVRVFDDGSIELLGRAPGAPPRGCSLAMEHLLEGDA